MSVRTCLILLLQLPALCFAGFPTDTVFATALQLQSDLQQGESAYLALCSQCHGEDAWGTADGEYPQLAGQHTSVIIKQLADIHGGIRINPAMTDVVARLVEGGPQMVSDIAAYLAALPMNPYPEWGEADDPGEIAPLYRQKCMQCHGEQGEGDAALFHPLLQGQHYEYLLRELRWLRDGRRGNAHPAMVEQLADVSEKELKLLADYLSRIEPPTERLGQE